VEKIDYNGTSISSVSNLRDVDRADGALGISRLIAKKTEGVFEELRILKAANERLSRLQRPAIVTEGVTDVEIIREAQQRILGHRDKYHVFCCESEAGKGGGHTNLKLLLENIPAREQSKRVGIFDRDIGGANSFRNLKGFVAINGNADIKKRVGGKIFGLLLPDSDWDDPYFDVAGRPVAIEQMFSPDVIGRDIIKYTFSTASGTMKQKKADDLIKAIGPAEFGQLVKTQIEVIDKGLAVQRIRKAPDEAFVAFTPIFEALQEIVG
jgi:hypothetical protein